MPHADCKHSHCLPGNIHDRQDAAHATQCWLPDAQQRAEHGCFLQMEQDRWVMCS